MILFFVYSFNNLLFDPIRDEIHDLPHSSLCSWSLTLYA